MNEITKGILKFNKDAGTELSRFSLPVNELENEVRMLKEEVTEFFEATRGVEWDKKSGICKLLSPEEQRIAIADALADIIVVAQGTMGKLGIDYEQVMAEVNRSNFSKYQDGKLVKNEAGKIQKGPNFKQPDLSFTAIPVEFEV